MAKRVLSIEFGIWWTKVCEVDYQKKNPHVYDAFYMETPEHAIEDGYIRDKEALASALKRELSKRRVDEKEVVFSINSAKVVTREVMIPLVKDKQIPGIVDTQAKEYFPMDVSNYTIAFNKLGVVDTEEGKKLKILLVAVPDNLLSNYGTFADAMGFEVAAYEYMGNSALQFLSHNVLYNSVIVQMEEQTTIISILADKKLVFQRVTPYGYSTALSTAMEHSVLDLDDEREAFAFLETHNVLYSTPRAADYPDSRVTDPQRRQELLEEAYADLQEALRYHIRMVSTAMDYYQNQAKAEFHGKIMMLGDGARFAGLTKLFEDEISLELEKPEYASQIHFANKNIIKNMPDPNAMGLVSLVGAVVQPLDITPKALREKAKKKGRRHDTVFILFVAAAASAGLTLVGFFRLTAAQQEQAELKREHQSLLYIEEIYQQNEAAKKEAASYQAFDRATVDRNEMMGQLIVDLETKLPQPVIVQSMNIAGEKISMNVKCDVKLTAAQLLLNLQEIPYLTDITIPSMSRNEDELGNPSWSYSISFAYTDPPETEQAADGKTTEGGAE